MSKQRPSLLTAQLAAMTKQRDTFKAHYLAANETAAESISERDRLANALEHWKGQYEFRHNQALAAGQTISELKRELADTQLQYAAFRRDITHLFMLEQFGGGRENDLILTRVRNRVLNELRPLPQPTLQDNGDVACVTPPSPEKLEDVGK